MNPYNSSSLSPAAARDSLGFAYRPEVDGLRAIAVLAVVLFHAELGCPGGYVGVDVFFVISGYLITSLILKELDRGTFSLGMFWERRIRRIFPALAVMVLFTAVAGWFLLLPDDLAKLGSSMVAQALGVSNFYFWRTTNYFGGQNLEKPLLHTWSLAVEEQFYLLFPLLLILVFSHVSLCRRASLQIAFTLTAAASLALSVWGVIHQPYATFFLLPTRAWELLCGSLLAVLPAAWNLRGIWLRESVCLLGLVGILVPVFAYTEETPFPGLAALPPCLGASLLIWCGRVHDDGRLTWSARLLAGKPVVFIGLISYSLYLWHWPVLVFADYWKTAPLPSWNRASFCAVAVVVAILSWHFVEKPFRKSGADGKGLRKTLLATLVCSILMAVWGITCFFWQGFPERLSPEALKILAEVRAANKHDPSGKHVPWVNTQDVLTGNIPKIGAEVSRRKILLWGDSHAELLTPVLDKICKEMSISGEVIASYSTPPLLNPDFKLRNCNIGTEAMGEAVMDFVKKERVTDVLLAAYWSNYQNIAGNQKFEDLLKHTVESLQVQGARVLIIMDPPTYPENITRKLLRNLVCGAKTNDNWKVTADRHRSMQDVLFRIKEQNTDTNLHFMDPSPALYSERDNSYQIFLDGILMYRDGNHLSPQGAEILFQPQLMRALLESKETAPK